MINTTDPEHLPRDYNPAVVKLTDSRELFVAHQVVKDSGWLWVVGWKGNNRRIPPHRIAYVEPVNVDVESDDSGTTRRKWKVITDQELINRARESTGLSETSDSEHRERKP